jgi:hypothetical protein
MSLRPRSWAWLVYFLLAASNSAQAALSFVGPKGALEPTIVRTWSLWTLGFLRVVEALPISWPISHLGAVAVYLPLGAGLLGVLLMGQRLFGTRFAIVALLLSLPLVTVMPGPDPLRESGLWLAATSIVLWHLALILGVIAALRVRSDLRGLLWIVVIAPFLNVLIYPIGRSLSMALLGAGVILARRRTNTKDESASAHRAPNRKVTSIDCDTMDRGRPTS